jgi:hypothetical protein
MVGKMKILTLYMAYFRLPDDFSGSTSDALRLMADYHDKVAGDSKSHKSIYKPMPPLDSTLSEAFGSTFDEFIDACRTTND